MESRQNDPPGYSFGLFKFFATNKMSFDSLNSAKWNRTKIMKLFKFFIYIIDFKFTKNVKILNRLVKF